MNLDSALANVGDTQKRRLIDQAILRIAVSDTSGPLTNLEINNLIIQINGKVGYSNKTKRGVITDALSKKDAIRLSDVLGIEDELDPWTQLREQKYSKEQPLEKKLFSWFQISEADLPAPIIVDIPPTWKEFVGLIFISSPKNCNPSSS